MQTGQCQGLLANTMWHKITREKEKKKLQFLNWTLAGSYSS